MEAPPPTTPESAHPDSAEIDDVWKALSDPTRRAILDLLRESRASTGDLAGAFPALTRFAVMKHLSVLEAAGLVVSRKEGRQKWNYLNAVPLRRVYERWVSRYQDRWAGSLVGLQRLAESQEDSPVPTDTINMSASVVQTEITIDAPPMKVYDLFFDRPNDWFYESEESRKTQTTKAERKIGGHFYIETAHPDGTSDHNVIGTITMLKPGRKVRMRGDCTMPNAFIANMTIAFEAAGNGTRVSIEHRMAGEFDDDLPAGFEEGWQDGLQKLKKLAEG
ncbi:MAG: metalloregulator ArsR/SmtB family transcription factor [Phycisphaera sp.]|nr:MAG: metalloregulator ArsR/SmtB family transcription factor [Phycisphaera sp.]